MQRRQFLAFTSAALLAACGRQEAQAKFHATDITGVDWARGFELTDHTGKRRTLEDFRGKVVMVFFGYTSCPDACPLALAEMAEAVRRLGPRLYISQTGRTVEHVVEDLKRLLAS